MADQPPTDEDPKETTTADNELLVLARRYGMAAGRPAGRVNSPDCGRAVRNVNTPGV